VKTPTTLLLTAAAVILAFGFATPTPQDFPEDMAQYWFGLIRRGESWSPEVTDEVLETQRGHLENIQRLVDAGKLVLAGPFGDGGDLRGIFIYDVATRVEAEELVASDPAVASGRLTVELHPWWGPTALRELATTFRSDGDEGDGDG
jgi:uncharacterized protein YciI